MYFVGFSQIPDTREIRGCFKLSGKEHIKTKQTETDSALKPIRSDFDRVWYFRLARVQQEGPTCHGEEQNMFKVQRLRFPRLKPSFELRNGNAYKIQQSKLFYCSQQEQSHFLDTIFITRAWWVPMHSQKQSWHVTSHRLPSRIRALKSQCHGNHHEANFLLGRLEPREPREPRDFEPFSWCSECLMHSS